MIRSGPVALLVAAAACTSIAPAPPLSGSEWRVTAINGRATPPPPASYVMRFEPRQVGGQFGCNHFGGDYRVNGDVLTTGAVAMTEMACGEPASSFESQGAAILVRPMRMNWDSAKRLRLANEAGTIELRR